MSLPGSPSHGSLGTLNNNDYQYDSDINAWVVLRNLSEKTIRNDIDSEVSVLRGFYYQGAQSAGYPVGSIIAFAHGVLPSGFLLCNGSQFSPFVYPKLYELLGTDRLPDLRNQFLRGFNNDSDGFGNARALLSTQSDDLKSHNHTYQRAVTIYDAGVNAYAANNNDGGQVLTNTSSVGGNETRPTNVSVLFGIAAYDGAGLVADSDTIYDIFQTHVGNFDSDVLILSQRITTTEVRLDSDELQLQNLQAQIDVHNVRLDSDELQLQNLQVQINVLSNRASVLESNADSDQIAIANLRRDADSDSLALQTITEEAISSNQTIQEILAMLDSDGVNIQALRTDLDSELNVVHNKIDNEVLIISGKLDSDYIVIQNLRTDLQHEILSKDSDIVTLKSFFYSGAQSSGYPVGSVIPFAKNQLPNGFLLANGSQFNALQYPELYNYLNGDILPDYTDRDLGFKTYDYNDTQTYDDLVFGIAAYNGAGINTDSELLTSLIREYAINQDSENNALRIKVQKLEADRDSDSIVIQGLREDLEQAIADRVYTDNLLSARITNNDSDIAQNGRFYVQATPPSGGPNSGWVNTTNMRLHVFDTSSDAWVEVTLT